MHPDPETAPKARVCKIKPVYPAFRSVSTPRRTKDLPVVGPVTRKPRSARLKAVPPQRSGAQKGSANDSE